MSKYRFFVGDIVEVQTLNNSWTKAKVEKVFDDDRGRAVYECGWNTPYAWSSTYHDHEIRRFNQTLNKK